MSLHDAALGGSRGPHWIASLLATGRTRRVVLFLVVIAVVSAVFVVAWAVFVVAGIPLLTLALGLAGWSGLAVVADGIARLCWHPHDDTGPILATAPSGIAATTWPRARGSMVRPVALVVVLVVLALGEVTAAVVGGFGWGFVAPVVLLAVAVWIGRPLRRARPGGLYLTVDGIEHVYGTDRVFVAWDDVVLWSRGGALGLVDRGGVRRERGGWRTWAATDRMVRREDVPVPTAFLTGRAPVIVEAVQEIQDDPEGSPTPGTIGSVGHLRELTALRRVTFRPASD